MSESEMRGVRCPCCGELIPVRIDMEGRGVDEGYVGLYGGSTGDDPFPHIEIDIRLDLERLAAGGLEELIKQEKDSEEFLKNLGHPTTKA